MRAASLSMDGSPQAPRVSEPEKKRGARSISSRGNPNSRLGRKSSPHLQGRVMERNLATPSFVGIDVSKSRLDIHVRPSGRAFATLRDGKGLERLVSDLVSYWCRDIDAGAVARREVRRRGSNRSLDRPRICHDHGGVRRPYPLTDSAPNVGNRHDALGHRQRASGYLTPTIRVRYGMT
jgi:hypothetical protein